MPPQPGHPGRSVLRAISGELLLQVWSADQVDSIIASLAAIIGVVLGSLLTYLFQARNARQAQVFARDQQFWQERLAAYSEFAGIVTDFPRS
jgi:membrane protein DedA with SNARE-associated domain